MIALGRPCRGSMVVGLSRLGVTPNDGIEVV
jgi:hypothetical protein